ncbi:MAG: aldo/keto reductase [Turicibacter sp.]|nr:aldo/keto reductase [Turicibacter sp.]
MQNKAYKLNNGIEIPKIGFGTWQTPDGDVAYQAVRKALEAGYRHIDTAAIYGNEESVGQAIRDSQVDRREIFLTSKAWNDIHTFEDAKAAIAESLHKLKTDYLDLYLIHWPNPASVRENWQTRNAQVWRAIEEAYEAGQFKAIGVSNFHPHHLDALLETAKIKPQVNQIYLSPSDQQEGLVRYNEKHGIVTEAYSPLGTGSLLEVDEVKDIAKKYGKSPAQVAIRWSLQKGFLPLPKSVTPARIFDNIQVFDFELSQDDMAALDRLKGTAKGATNPDATQF